MKLLNIIHEDFINFREPAMVLEFPYCTFKCNKECNKEVCQNTALVNSETVEITIDEIINQYLNNPITSSIVMQGLEPFDSFKDVHEFIHEFRKHSKDYIVIYTGYAKYEIIEKIRILQPYGRIILKLGRFLPGYKPHLDVVLGVKLASDNQHAYYIEEF